MEEEKIEIVQVTFDEWDEVNDAGNQSLCRVGDPDCEACQ